jgi:tetratricopeptide (TPR) repeat protein
MRFLCRCALLLPLAPMALPAQGSSGGNDPLVFVKKGIAQNAKGDLNGALDSFNRALAIDPNDSAAFEGRGETRLAQGDMADAMDDFSRTLKIEPQNEAAFYHRGLAESRLGNFKPAIADFDQAIESTNIAPGESPSLYLERGRAKYLQGDFDGALTDLNQAVTLNSRLGESYFLRGFAEDAKGQPDPAADDFAKAATLGVPKAALWWWDAKMEGHHEDDANAGLSFLLNKGLAGHPNPWVTELGNFLLQKTTETQVQADAQNGKAGENRQPESWFFIGLTRELAGDPAGAKQAYQQAIDAGVPASALTTESHRHLKKLSP